MTVYLFKGEMVLDIFLPFFLRRSSIMIALIVNIFPILAIVARPEIDTSLKKFGQSFEALDEGYA